MDSQEATLLVHMIIWATKYKPAKASKGESVIAAAIGMAANQTAIARMAEELVISPTVAKCFLERVHGAAVVLASENGVIQDRARQPIAFFKSIVDFRP